jgi:hypothetical protein
MLASEVEVTKIIQEIGGERVLLDTDLAVIYGVSVKRLNEAMQRNRKRFPPDFCFQISASEWENLRSQFATAKFSKRRSLPWAYTEHGAIMAANTLRSPRAIQMSVFVVRAFIRMRQTLTNSAALISKLEKLEKEVTSRLDSHETAIVQLMQQFFKILNPPAESGAEEPKREIGFHVKDKHETASAKTKRVR